MIENPFKNKVMEPAYREAFDDFVKNVRADESFFSKGDKTSKVDMVPMLKDVIVKLNEILRGYNNLSNPEDRLAILSRLGRVKSAVDTVCNMHPDVAAEVLHNFFDQMISTNIPEEDQKKIRHLGNKR